MKNKKQKITTEEINTTEKNLISLYKNLEDMIENVEAYIEQSSQKIKDERQESEKILAKMEETYAKILQQQNNNKHKLHVQEVIDAYSKVKVKKDVDERSKRETIETKHTMQHVQLENPVEPKKTKEPKKLEEPKKLNKITESLEATMPIEPSVTNDPNEPSRPSKQNKVELVRDLHSQGMNIEQISKKMGISQGEVNLIMGIRK